MKANPKSILVFPNGMTAAFDQSGQQIPELQISLLGLYADYAEKLGYSPEGWIVEIPPGRLRFFVSSEGKWNCEEAKY